METLSIFIAETSSKSPFFILQNTLSLTQKWKLVSSAGHFIHRIIVAFRIPVLTTVLLIKVDNPESAYYQNAFRSVCFFYMPEITNLDRIALFHHNSNSIFHYRYTAVQHPILNSSRHYGLSSFNHLFIYFKCTALAGSQMFTFNQ